MRRYRAAAFVVAVFLAVGLSGYAVYRAVDATQDRSEENRLLFKFACALPLAVAERLDELSQASSKNPSHTPEALRRFERYHEDFQRGKNICPPISREESTRLMEILTDLGGKPPDPQPGR